MSQNDKKQADKTKNQLIDSLQKSKSAGSTPATAPKQNSKASNETQAQNKRAENATPGFSLGGLRWPD